MQVRHVFATVGKIALGCLVVLTFAALATVGTFLGLGLRLGSLSSSPIPSPDAALVSPSEVSPLAAAPAEISLSATPAEVVATRFRPDDAGPPQAPPAFSTSSVIPGERVEPFDINALSGRATTVPPWPAANGTAPATAAIEEPARQSDPAKSELSKASPYRATARSPNVLNDAMIASIRKRLNLTAEQQKLWPAVEAALRKIVYTPAAMSPQGRGQGGGAYIDPASAEVRELKSAAIPLLMRLTNEQKSEVKKLAYIMGLEAVVSQF
jgi:hypothetical protein